MLLDDVGFGASSTFGGPVQTPTLDRLAQNGLRYTQFHTTALCSPTRAALLTGRNHHSVHTGVIMEQATGFPGYDSVMRPDTATVAEVLRQQGWNTAWFGKNHNVPDWQSSQAGPFDLWPTRLGFDRFYGFVGAETSQWRPAVFDGTQPVEPYLGNPEYNFDYDIADQAIRWIRNQKAVAPDRPFFLYYAPGATHSPHHPRKEWIAKYQGRFDQGWDRVREETLARQKQLGIVPADTQLTPRHDGIPAWDSLDAEQTAAVRLHDGGLRRLPRADRPQRRPRAERHRQARPARQHAGRIHRRRQRRERRRPGPGRAERARRHQRRGGGLP